MLCEIYENKPLQNIFKLESNFKVNLFLFCTNGSFQLKKNVSLKVLKE